MGNWMQRQNEARVARAKQRAIVIDDGEIAGRNGYSNPNSGSEYVWIDEQANAPLTAEQWQTLLMNQREADTRREFGLREGYFDVPKDREALLQLINQKFGPKGVEIAESSENAFLFGRLQEVDVGWVHYGICCVPCESFRQQSIKASAVAGADLLETVYLPLIGNLACAHKGRIEKDIRAQFTRAKDALEERRLKSKQEPDDDARILRQQSVAQSVATKFGDFPNRIAGSSIFKAEYQPDDTKKIKLVLAPTGQQFNTYRRENGLTRLEAVWVTGIDQLRGRDPAMCEVVLLDGWDTSAFRFGDSTFKDELAKFGIFAPKPEMPRADEGLAVLYQKLGLEALYQKLMAEQQPGASPLPEPPPKVERPMLTQKIERKIVFHDE